MKYILSLVALATIIFSCTPENLQAPDEDKTLTFDDINLQEGLSKWLTSDQQAQFSEVELAELDALLINGTLPNEIESRTTVEVPAESQDALAAAIAEAGEGGTVILKAGDHFESNTVVIPQSVTIRGEAGAVLISSVEATPIATFIQPALHIQNADNVRIQDLMIQPASEVGGTGILVDNSEQAFLVRNTLNDFEFGILIEQGNFAKVVNNKVNTTLAWSTGELPFAHGLTVINGDNTRILGNIFTNSFFGAWTCDESGLYLGNTTTSNFIGNILCNVPIGAFPLSDGRMIGSENPGTNWLTLYNKSFGNVNTGYLIIDGAAENYLVGNVAGDNGAYDFEFAGDSERFGFFTPTSVGNRAFISNEYTVKDCGLDNDITGGIVVDTADDPCF